MATIEKPTSFHSSPSKVNNDALAVHPETSEQQSPLRQSVDNFIGTVSQLGIKAWNLRATTHLSHWFTTPRFNYAAAIASWTESLVVSRIPTGPQIGLLDPPRVQNLIEQMVALARTKIAYRINKMGTFYGSESRHFFSDTIKSFQQNIHQAASRIEALSQDYLFLHSLSQKSFAEVETLLLTESERIQRLFGTYDVGTIRNSAHRTLTALSRQINNDIAQLNSALRHGLIDNSLIRYANGSSFFGPLTFMFGLTNFWGGAPDEMPLWLRGLKGLADLTTVSGGLGMTWSTQYLQNNRIYPAIASNNASTRFSLAGMAVSSMIESGFRIYQNLNRSARLPLNPLIADGLRFFSASAMLYASATHNRRAGRAALALEVISWGIGKETAAEKELYQAILNAAGGSSLTRAECGKHIENAVECEELEAALLQYASDLDFEALDRLIKKLSNQEEITLRLLMKKLRNEDRDLPHLLYHPVMETPLFSQNSDVDFKPAPPFIKAQGVTLGQLLFLMQGGVKLSLREE